MIGRVQGLPGRRRGVGVAGGHGVYVRDQVRGFRDGEVGAEQAEVDGERLRVSAPVSSTQRSASRGVTVPMAAVMRSAICSVGACTTTRHDSARRPMTSPAHLVHGLLGSSRGKGCAGGGGRRGTSVRRPVRRRRPHEVSPPPPGDQPVRLHLPPARRAVVAAVVEAQVLVVAASGGEDALRLRAHGGDLVDAFRLVIPSLPGFSLSGPTREHGWDRHRIAAPGPS